MNTKTKYQIPDKSALKIVKKPLTMGQYITERHPKKAIFLHHTAGGSWQGTWDWWNKTPERIGTAFIIDRDGTIIQAFEPEMWAFHLGIKGTNLPDRCSIGIELCSWGQLRKKGDKFYAYPDNFNKIVIPNDEVLELDWRGEKYFQEYTEKQIESLGNLLIDLKEKFPSLAYKETPKKFWEFNQSVISQTKGGIFSHTTVRRDKIDIAPQKSLISMVEAIKNLYQKE